MNHAASEGESIPPPGTQVAAFFDLDRTILSVNSARLWISRERSERRISRLQLLEGVAFLLGYGLGIVRIESGLHRAVRTLKGIPEAEMAARVEKWFWDEVVQTILPQAEHAIEHHRAAGHRLVLLTSSSPYVSRAVVQRLQMDHFLCSSFVVENGIFTGEPVLPFCFGEGKVILARSWAEQTGVSLAHSYFYTDSHTDLPMLEVVGHPRVTNPDPRLRRLAMKRGWPILDWAPRRLERLRTRRASASGQKA